jgi:hypothetical protein
MAKKKVIPQIVKDVRAFKQQEIDWVNQKLISYSQFSMFNDQGEQAEIDEPVKSDYPLVRYNQLHCSYE